MGIFGGYHAGIATFAGLASSWRLDPSVANSLASASLFPLRKALTRVLARMPVYLFVFTCSCDLCVQAKRNAESKVGKAKQRDPPQTMEKIMYT